MNKKNIYCFVFFILIFSAISTIGSQENYYVSNGPGTPVYSKTGNPNDEKDVVEWQIKLYSSNQVAGGGVPWGTIDSKTYEGAMKKLKAAQDFQRAYARWSNTDENSDMNGYFNPFGPIAILKENKLQSSDNKSRLDEAYYKIAGLKKDYWELYQEYKKKMQEKSDALGKSKMSEVGKVLTEYAENLKKAEDRVHKLYKELDYSYDFYMKDIVNGMNDIFNGINKMDSYKSIVSNSLKNLNPLSAQNELKGKSNSASDKNNQPNSETSENVKNDNSNKSGTTLNNHEWDAGATFVVINITVFNAANNEIARFVSSPTAVPKSENNFEGKLQKYLNTNFEWVKKYGINHWLNDGQNNMINGGTNNSGAPKFELRVLIDSPDKPDERCAGLWSYWVEESQNNPSNPYPTFCIINYNNGGFTFTESSNTPTTAGYKKTDINKYSNQTKQKEKQYGNYEGAGNVK